MATETKNDIVDEKEFEHAVAESENASSLVTIKLRKPITYNGKEIKELSFDFDKLTGRDGLAIEEEISLSGKSVIAPVFSIHYLVRMAARACTEKIGIDLFDYISLKDFDRVRSAARSFLLRKG